ncbi:phage gene 29 protein family protein [Mycobacteroides abscessus]|uniref:phage gene 29 protein family protein n=2 Tax=Mycobacteroides abscessus TaxID=36809 RepID=UPI000928BEE0|nr:hypothetical protein [Mycobacteroides abscessus]RIU21392.1 hypothetical protein D2E92_24660 [Mycobacteroides abscessus]SHQ52486.1 Bacteriophage protein [Mycobacteroides abscessus subsp. abscessus]SHU90628.1 Bacteriophage protein [Mycobacteroides abscessus subsp. abscessus]SHW18252.1 Bacteriophage protein [Mycobacteroides abscessus subsp. abscessus]SHY10186.1 bacteriophage protein [Mycobacteroides abscessus subsp. abscessus]
MAADKYVPRALQVYAEKQKAQDAQKAEMESAYQDFLTDCHYPQDKDGNRMDSAHFVWLVGYHMIRCGWRRSAQPLIKPRAVEAPGVVEGAIEWVPVDAPDDPLEGVENMTFAQINALPEWLKRKAIQRLNGNQDADDDLPEMAEPAWRVTPNIAIKDERPIGDDFVKGIENG